MPNIEKGRIHYWSHTGKCGVPIEYDGVPFMHVGRWVLMCHQGQDTNKRHKEKYQIRKHIEQQASFFFLLAFLHFHIKFINRIFIYLLLLLITLLMLLLLFLKFYSIFGIMQLITVLPIILQESGVTPKSRNRTQVTKKVNCPAEIYVNHIMKFPQHKVHKVLLRPIWLC